MQNYGMIIICFSTHFYMLNYVSMRSSTCAFD
jgi:hypothetical protein